MPRLIEKRRGKGQSTYEIKGDLGGYSSGKAWAEATLVTSQGHALYNHIYLGGPNRWFVKIPTGSLGLVREYTTSTQTQYVDELGQPMSVDPSRLPENQGFSTKYKTIQELPLKPEAVALAQKQYIPKPSQPDPYQNLPPVVKESAIATDYITGVVGRKDVKAGLSASSGFIGGPFAPAEFKEAQARGFLTAIPALPYATYSLVTKPAESLGSMWTQATTKPLIFFGEMAGASAVLSKIPIPKLRGPTYEVTALTGVERSITKYTYGTGGKIAKGLAGEEGVINVFTEPGNLGKHYFSPVDLLKGGKLKKPTQGIVEEIKPVLETYKTRAKPEIPSFEMREVKTVFGEAKAVKSGEFIVMQRAAKYYRPFEIGTKPEGSPITTTLKNPLSSKELAKIYKEKGLTRKPVLEEFRKPPAKTIPEAPPKTIPEAPLAPSRMLGEAGIKTRIRPELLTKQSLKNVPVLIEEIPATLPRGMSVPVAAASISKSILKPRLGVSGRLDSEPRLDQSGRVNIGSRTVTREVQTLMPRVKSAQTVTPNVRQDLTSRLVTRSSARSIYPFRPEPRNTLTPSYVPRGPLVSSSKFKAPRSSALAPAGGTKTLKGGGGLKFFGKRTGLSDVIFSAAKGSKKIKAAGGFFKRKRGVL